MKWLAHHAAHDVVAFDAQGQSTDAASFRAHVRGLCEALSSAPPSAPCLLAFDDRFHFATALTACLLRRLTPVLPANGQPDNVHALAARLEAFSVLHDRDAGQGIDVRHVKAVADTGPAVEVADAPLWMYTSGSTGEPARHEKKLSQLLAEVDALVSAFDLAGRRAVSLVPAQHIYGLLFGVLVPLCAGGSFSRGSPLHAAEVVAYLERAKADVLVAVPPHLAALSEADVRFPSLHRTFSSGGPLRASVSQALRARGLPITEVLGSTETGGIASRTRSESLWQPLPGAVVSCDAEGVLLFDAPWLPEGAPRPMRGHDRIAVSAEGFSHLGRSDSVVKVGGLRVDRADIEARLCAVEGVRDARVIALSGAGMRSVLLCAAVEADDVSPSALRSELVRHLDPVTIPRRFRVVSRLPRTASGKVAERDIEALFDSWELPFDEHDGVVRFRVPENSGYFRGHFDGHPVLPGVVQIQYLALDAARRRFPELGSLRRVTRIKLKRLVTPGEELALTLTRNKPAMVTFRLQVEGELASSGIFHFAEVPT